MPPKLDKIDLRVLYELDRDCRVPLSYIGKKIRKSPQYVKYRAERLKYEGIIKGVAVLLDLPPGASEVYCFVKLKGSDVIEEKKLLDFLFKMPETYRLYWCDGLFDIVASFIVTDSKRLDEIKNVLLSHFYGVEKVFFNTVGFSEIYIKKYLVDSLGPERIVLEKRRSDFGELEKKVLFELQRNPFASLLEISKSLAISYDSVKYLFRKSKPFKGTRLMLTDNVQIVRKAILLVDVVKDFEKLQEYCLSHKNVVQLDNLVGKYNYAVFFECLSDQELHRIIKEFTYNFKDSLRDPVRLDIVNTFKYRCSVS